MISRKNEHIESLKQQFLDYESTFSYLPEETGKKSVSVFSRLPPSVQKQPCQKDHQKCHADQDRKHILPHPRTCRLLFPGCFLRILLFCDTMSSYQEPMAVDAIGCTGYQRYQIFFRNDPKK